MIDAPPTKIGCVGASSITDVMAKGRNGQPSATRKNYMAEIITARLTGRWPEKRKTPEMIWGNENEPKAKVAFEYKYDLELTDTPFVPHPTIEWAGASPDSFEGKNATVEIKCPNSAQHMSYLIDARQGNAPTKYIKQCQWQLACTDRDFCWFVTYDPRMPIDLQIERVRVNRDEKMISEITIAVMAFLEETQTLINVLTKNQ